jgi:diguanylate cyclase (GGDEF)-like protein
MLDIDHFKRINDTYGHLSGDRVLQGVAEICRASIRSVDILARYGGEEFVMMLPETDVQLAYNVAERIRLAVALTPLVSTHGDLHITVSLGVYTCVPGNSEESEIELTRMVEHADQALYQSKQAGRNRTTSTK